MPILILFGIFAGYGAISFVQSCKTNAITRVKINVIIFFIVYSPLYISMKY